MKQIPLILKNSRWCLVGLCFLLVPGVVGAAGQDGILAVVDSEVITYQDLNEYLKSRYVQLKADGKTEEEIRQIMDDMEKHGIKRLIQDKLIVAEANKLGMQIRKEAVDQRVISVKAKYPSEKVFEIMLEQDGMTISDLRKRIEDQLKVQQLIETEVKAKVYVSPQDITDFYNKNVEQYRRSERLSLDSIFVAKGPDPAKAREKIQKAAELVKSNQDFRSTVQTFSETPAFGVVSKNKLLPKIEETVDKLNVNQTSEIIEVDNGFYIFKLLAKMPAQTVPLDEVKDTIQQIIFQEKFLKQINSWLEELEKKSFIDIKDDSE